MKTTLQVKGDLCITQLHTDIGSPGDDDAVLELLVPSKQLSSEDSYRNKFRNWPVEAEGIRLALVGKRIVGHVLGMHIPFFIEEKVQKFGMVTLVHVAPNKRRQGIATRLMQEPHAHFQRKRYRGSILDTDEEAAIRFYQKVGYHQFTRHLQTALPPNPNSSQLTWTKVNLKDLNALAQLNERWARYNFPTNYDHQSMKVHRYNMRGYRVLRHGGNIVGYAEWGEPSKHRPQGSIRDPYRSRFGTDGSNCISTGSDSCYTYVGNSRRRKV